MPQFPPTFLQDTCLYPLEAKAIALKPEPDRVYSGTGMAVSVANRRFTNWSDRCGMDIGTRRHYPPFWCSSSVNLVQDSKIGKGEGRIPLGSFTLKAILSLSKRFLMEMETPAVGIQFSHSSGRLRWVIAPSRWIVTSDMSPCFSMRYSWVTISHSSMARSPTAYCAHSTTGPKKSRMTPFLFSASLDG